MKLKGQDPVAFFDDRAHVFELRHETDIFPPCISTLETGAAAEYFSIRVMECFYLQIIASFHRGRYLFSLPDNKPERGYLLHTVF
jgi:hypothetical protein